MKTPIANTVADTEENSRQSESAIGTNPAFSDAMIKAKVPSSLFIASLISY